MKIKVHDNNRSKSFEVGDANLSQFTDAEINSIFPASDLLNKINFDHVYSTNGNSSIRLKYHPKESKSLSFVGRDPTKSRQDHENTTLDKSRSDTWADESYDEETSDDSFTDDPTLSLNADSIQQVFQRMLDLTSLDAIDNQSSDLKADDHNDKSKSTPMKKVVFVDELPGTSKSSPVTSTLQCASSNKLSAISALKQDSKTTPKKSKKSTKPQKTSVSVSQSKSTKVQKNGKSKTPNKSKTQQNDVASRNKPDDDECKRRLAKKYAEAEREMNILLNYTRELLVKRWGEYLCMTTEKIRAFEIENARQQQMMEDVVDMLEDKDLYVWQLIEDLRFF